MTEYRAEFQMKPPSRLQRVWYRRMGMTPPLSEGSTAGRRGDWARLVPYRFRRFHHGYAAANGFFWLPCPLCDRPFGGHEWGDDVPDPQQAFEDDYNPDDSLQPTRSVGICSRCTIARNKRQAISSREGE